MTAEKQIQATSLERTKAENVMSLNRAMAIGNLGGDLELRYLPSGQPAGGFSIATNESITDKQGEKQERVEWHHIVAFGKLAETCNDYLKKGRQVYVEGRLRTREFEAKHDGGKRQHTEIVASQVQFLGPAPTDRAEANAIDNPLEPSDSVPF